jgi:polysaccharide biosynthesis protein PslH
MNKPRVLYVTPCWPHGKPFGSQMRVLHIARALGRMADLKLAVIDLIGSDTEAARKTSEEFEVVSHGTARKGGELSWAGRVRHALDRRVVNPHGLALDPAFRNNILEQAENVDLVWFTNLKPVSSLERWSWPRSVLDIDDVPSTYERTVAQNGSSLCARLRARSRMLVWRRRERCLAERFTVLAVCSEADRRYLGARSPVHVIPNGFERPAQAPERRVATPPRLGFIGPFDYPPNAQGIAWFVDQCWPRIKRQQPSLRLRLVGKGSDGPLGPSGPDIDALGWAADPADEIATWNAMIVPIRFGAGTRIKVLEAFSRKCPIVGTRVGVFGHEVNHGQELLLADSPEDFASACVQLVRDPDRAAGLAERAWQRFLKEWTWEASAPRVWAAAEDCLTRSRTRPQQLRVEPSPTSPPALADGRKLA